MNKEPLVMVHGLMGSLNYFSPSGYFKQLDVFTPNLIGYGTRQTELPNSLAQQAQSVLEYIETEVKHPCWILGHSVGGAIAMILANLQPEMVKGIISVEGNFTLNDAFWCKTISERSANEWGLEYEAIQGDPEAWLSQSVPEVTTQRLAWAKEVLHNQPATTIQAQAKAVICETGDEVYPETIKHLISLDIPIFLLSGERSKDSWDVPDWVARAAKKSVVQPNTGHMMMLEAPEVFCQLVESLILGL